jgi:hypothetical protein
MMDQNKAALSAQAAVVCVSEASEGGRAWPLLASGMRSRRTYAGRQHLGRTESLSHVLFESALKRYSASKKEIQSKLN